MCVKEKENNRVIGIRRARKTIKTANEYLE